MRFYKREIVNQLIREAVGDALQLTDQLHAVATLQAQRCGEPEVLESPTKVGSVMDQRM